MKQKVRVWDLPTRIFHWTLVLCIPFLWWSASTGGEWLQKHLIVGCVVLGLLIFRIIWGFIGSQSARFSNFIKGPKQIKRYLTGEMTENEQPGHNPLGGLMVIALLLLLLTQVTTGLLSPDENSYLYDGFLAKFVSSDTASAARDIHVQLFWVIVGFAAIHVLSVFAYLIIKKIDLISAMFTGKKKMEGQLPTLKFTSLGVAIVLALIIAAVIYFSFF